MFDQDFEQFITDIYHDVIKITDGKVADYIPQLAKVNPDLFGISICNIDGTIINIGDSDIDVCIQSCSKPLSYCIAHQLYGSEHVHSCVGYEPSGQSFNSFVLNSQGLPHNPMINSGAIMVSSMIAKDQEPSDRFELIKTYYNRMAGNIGNIGFDNSVYLSEQRHADRNISLAYYMRENKSFGHDITPHEIQDSLNLYFQACSITLNTKMSSIIASTLATGGTCPITSDKIFDIKTVRDCLTLMYGCGMYDYSGEFAFQVGLPAKSGVSGLILLVIPGKCGVSIWSPRLDKQGNSVRGLEICRRIAKKLNVHMFHKIFDNIFDTSVPTSPIPVPEPNKEILIQKLLSFASRGELDHIKTLVGLINFNTMDYDKRTALHLAAAEGHLDIVQYLVNEHNVLLNVKDRWGNTALSEAKQKTSPQYKDIVNFLIQINTVIRLQRWIRNHIKQRYPT